MQDGKLDKNRKKKKNDTKLKKINVRKKYWFAYFLFNEKKKKLFKFLESL